MGTLESSPSLVDVALPLPVDRIFTYRIPDSITRPVVPGCRVLVPFGPRRMTGYVLKTRKRAPGKIRLKEIASLVDAEPLLTEELLDLAGWMSDYYVHTIGEILGSMLPAGIKGRGRLSLRDEPDGAFPADVEYPGLTPGQQAVYEAIIAGFDAGGFGKYLLHGVTGSGKTEVYLRCIEEALGRGKSALVLIPEIALIPQTTSRFRRRFGDRIAVLHSRLTGPQRCSIWREARSGEIRVVIGARSSVFVPLRDIGIIVIDEEQDTSFKQEDKPHYNAVTVAERRARNEGALLLLGSATPSLETYDSARKGETACFVLHERPNAGRMPHIDIVDMREREGILSDELIDALGRSVARGGQAIILLNRRGHANFIRCTKCGWIPACSNCSISLTFHSRGHELMCHYCGSRTRPPSFCPECGEYRIVHKGAGTQRIEMEIMNLVPGARVIRMDLDSTAGKRGHQTILERFARGEANVLLGTQMVAKGHHFPDVTLVGVIAADRGLSFPDFRSAERTFRLLSQASGRTGRGGKEGKVIIQTYVPEHYLFEHLVDHDYEGFAAKELDMRYELRYPPGGRLTLFTVSSPSRENAVAGAGRVAAALETASRGCDVLGPVPALIERLRRKYRIQILVRGELTPALNRKLVKAARAAVSKLSRTDVQWDVDPVSIV